MKRLLGLLIAFSSFVVCVVVCAFAPWWVVLPAIGCGMLFVTVARR